VAPPRSQALGSHGSRPRRHDVRTVAGRLGHANPAMTLRVYAHVVEGADEALASSLGRVLDGAPPSRSQS
jgi:hypothetical protein